MLGGALLWLPVSQLPPRSAIIPKTAAIVIMVSGIILCASSLRVGEKVPPAVSLGADTIKRIMVLGAAMLMVYFLIPILGFYSALLLLSVTGVVVFQKQLNAKAILIAALYSFVLIAVLLLLFRSVLGLPAPQGLFL